MSDERVDLFRFWLAWAGAMLVILCLVLLFVLGGYEHAVGLSKTLYHILSVFADEFFNG